MQQGLVYYPRQNRNLCPTPTNGISPVPDPRWNQVRDTMGYIRGYADRMNLAAMAPRGDLASSGHALAGMIKGHGEVLVYAPSGGALDVDLSAVNVPFDVEWMNPETGVRTQGKPVHGGGTVTLFPPFRFGEDAVLYLREAAGG
jgi:Putative collagen-binding domain of a collagenase